MAEEVPRVKGFRDFMRRIGWILLASLFLLTGLGFGVYAFLQGNNGKGSQVNQLKGTKLSGYQPIKKIDNFSYKDIKVGAGAEVKNGDKVALNYIGALADSGIIFDDSYDGGQPITFELKPGTVIPGFYLGVLGMKVGGQRHLYIPANMAYGANPPVGSGIPPNADLVFDVVVESKQ